LSVPFLFHAGIVLLRGPRESQEVLVVDVSVPAYEHSPAQTQTKFPGGTNKDHPEDDTPLRTALRELFEETGLQLKQGAQFLYTIYNSKKGWSSFYFVFREEDFEGQMYAEGRWDGKDWLSAPYWISNKDHRRIYKTQQSVLYQLNMYLARKH
jgi:8-oxo-dGTP pyrophosphatase MutT (NUDIX family)